MLDLTPPIRGQSMVLCSVEVPDEIIYRSRDPERASRVFDILETMWNRGVLARALRCHEGAAPVFDLATLPDGYTVTHRRGGTVHDLYSSKCPADAGMFLEAARRLATIAAMQQAS